MKRQQIEHIDPEIARSSQLCALSVQFKRNRDIVRRTAP